MRYLIAVEGHRDYEPYFIDLDEKFLEEHPDVVFKVGEILRTFLKDGGQIKREN